MRLLGHTEQLQRVIRIDPGLNHLFGNVVGAFGIHRHAIHLEIERKTFLVGFLHNLNGLDTGRNLSGIQQLAILFQHDLKIIERLVSHLIGPPKLWILDIETEHLMMVAVFLLEREALEHVASGGALHIKVERQLGLAF